jgi:hypothetical protein
MPARSSPPQLSRDIQEQELVACSTPSHKEVVDLFVSTRLSFRVSPSLWASSWFHNDRKQSFSDQQHNDGGYIQEVIDLFPGMTYVQHTNISKALKEGQWIGGISFWTNKWE